MSTLADLNTYSATSVVATATAEATFVKGKKNTIPVSTWDVARELGTLGTTGTLTVNHVFLTGYTSYTHRDIVLNTAVTPDNSVTLTAVSGTEYTITGMSTQLDYLYGSVLMDMTLDCTFGVTNPDITLTTTITNSVSSRTFVINTTIHVADNPQLLPGQGDLQDIVFTADATVDIGTITPKISDKVRSQSLPLEYNFRKQFDLTSGPSNDEITTAAAKFGTYGLEIDGSGGKIGAPYTTPISLTGDFTVELWWKRISTGSNPFSFGFYNIGLVNQISTNSVTIFTPPSPPGVYGSTRIDANFFGIETSDGSGTAPADPIGSNVWQADTWQHYAIWRKDGVIRHALDGQIMTVNNEGDTSKADTQTFTISNIEIGSSRAIDVYYDDYRLSSVARYGTTNFTPPTATFVNDSSTLCLLDFEYNNSTVQANITATYDRSDFQANTADPHILDSNLYELEIETDDSPQTIVLTTTSTEPLNENSVPWNYYDPLGSLTYIGTREAINSYLQSMSITYNKTYTPATSEIEFYDPSASSSITCANNTITIPKGISPNGHYIYFESIPGGPNSLDYSTVNTIEFLAIGNNNTIAYGLNNPPSGFPLTSLRLAVVGNTYYYGNFTTDNSGQIVNQYQTVSGPINTGYNHYAIVQHPTNAHYWSIWVNGVQQKPAYDYVNSVSIPDGYIEGGPWDQFGPSIGGGNTVYMQKLRVSSSRRYSADFDSSTYQNNFVPLDTDTICLFRFDNSTPTVYSPSIIAGHTDAATYPALSSSPREITYTLTNPIGCVTTVTQPYVEDTE